MKKNNPTTQIGELLNKTAFGESIKGQKFGQIIKQSTIFSFWNNIVGAKFAKYTKPYAIKFQKLYVSAKSPVLVQELSLYKAKIIKNINSYSMPLGIEIKDIIFSYKNYAASIPETLSDYKEDKPVEITQNQLNELELDENIKEKLKTNIDKIKFLNDEQKDNFSKKIIDTYKAKLIQE